MLSNSATSAPSERFSTRIPPTARNRWRRLLVGDADRLVRRGGQLGRRTELGFEPMGEHLELQLTDGGEDRSGVADVGVAQHLHDTLLVELRQALAELLEPSRVLRSGRHEHLGCEAGDAGEVDRLAVVERVAEVQLGGVDEPDHVTRERLVHRGALGTEDRRRVLRGEGPPGALIGQGHAALEPTGADAHERDAVSMGPIHVRLHLEHEGRARRVERALAAIDGRTWRRGRGEIDHCIEQVADPEVRERRADEDRRRAAGEERGKVDIGADRIHQTGAVERLRPRGALFGLGLLGRDLLLGRHGRAAGGPRESGEDAAAPVDDAAELAVVPHRPGDRCRSEIDLRLDLIEQFEHVETRPVELVEERDHGQLPGTADLEQLERLRLDALGRIEHHDDRVDGGEHAIGVLGEVPVARRVEQVDHVVAVGELQDGRRDRDAPGLLELHPVGRGTAPPGPGVH